VGCTRRRLVVRSTDFIYDLGLESLHCLAKFLDLLGIDQAYILGISWGGLLALEFYRLYPARVPKFILADMYLGWKGSLPEPVCQQRYVRCERDA
jgi:pimeloyl-ACP methyl ester carboxylesterase